MPQTIVGLNNPIAVKRWSATLFTDFARESYWGSRFMSKAADAPTPVQVLTELQNDAGDTINYDLFMQLTQKPTYGDERLEGKQEKLKNFSDKVQIDQVRTLVSAGGRMSRKRTLHDLRAVCRSKMAEWWARWGDETNFIYASGARGSNNDFVESLDYSGFAGNALQAPDADHQLFGGDATSFATIASDDTLDLALIDRAVTKAQTMGGGSDGKIRVRPIKINGENRYVLTMHTFQEHSLRTSSTGLTWAEIQKAALTNQGANGALFTGALGMYRGVVLHSHPSAIRFNNAGTDGLQPAARALLHGAQSVVMAFGSPGDGMRFDWTEKMLDVDNELVIGSGAILGVKKATFNGKWFSSLALDTYAADPNA